MKQFVWIILGLLSFLATAWAQQEVIGNDAVVRMVKAGIGDDVIIAVIRTAKKVDFTVTENSVVALKEAGVSQAIIKVLVERQATATEAPQPAPVGPERQILKPASDPPPSPPPVDRPRFPAIFAEEVTSEGVVITSSETLLEAIKTLNKKKMQVVTVRDRADYVLRITRELGKKSWRKDVKVVLSDRAGSVVYANSTRSVGGAMGDIADFILKRQQ
jgi:hypothetical protein